MLLKGTGSLSGLIIFLDAFRVGFKSKREANHDHVCSSIPFPGKFTFDNPDLELSKPLNFKHIES